MDTDAMITESITLIKLTASEGMMLTNGESYGKEVYLGSNDTEDRWREIPEADVPTDNDTRHPYKYAESSQESGYFGSPGEE